MGTKTHNFIVVLTSFLVFSDSHDAVKSDAESIEFARENCINFLKIEFVSL